MQNVDKHLCVEPYRETQNLEAGPMVTIYYSFTRYSYIDLSLNSTNYLR